MISKKISILLAVAIALLIVGIGMSLEPIPQAPSYHNFADQRSWLGIPNAGDVLSNLPFFLAGVWGLYLLFTPQKIQFINNHERWPWVGVSLGLILTAFGSSYYHLAPDNARLLWDRLPIIITFMSIAAALITERINVRTGLWLWPVLLIIGIYSVLQWHYSELYGIGDLRFYFSLQLFVMLLMIIMLWVPSRYNRTRDLAMATVLYGLAKLFEALDHQVFEWTRNTISGHTLKHLAAAMAGICLLWMISKRKII